MSVAIANASRTVVKQLIAATDNVEILDRCLSATQELWVGWHNDRPVFTWGLIPPTLLSSVAYLWMISIDEAEKHEFVIVRHSQIAMQRMLESYETIVGHCEVSETRSIRWLKWLGATFGPPDGRFIPFIIRRDT